MPNHVINKLYASAEVIDALKGKDSDVDFSTVIPYPEGIFFGDGGINTLAQDCAEKAFNEPLNEHPLIAALEASNKAKWSASDLSDDGFEQFIGMLRSKRSTGFYQVMQFCTETWGTKWNAYQVSRKDDRVEFETAWSTPEPVFFALSARFPDETIKVEYADEDRGTNCGTLEILGGKVVERTKGDLNFAFDLWGDDEERRRDYMDDDEDAA